MQPGALPFGVTFIRNGHRFPCPWRQVAYRTRAWIWIFAALCLRRLPVFSRNRWISCDRSAQNISLPTTSWALDSIRLTIMIWQNHLILSLGTTIRAPDGIWRRKWTMLIWRSDTIRLAVSKGNLSG